eukprot:g4985.t1
MTASSEVGETSHQRAKFRLFQTQYLVVYLLTMYADWLQGTHMYALYEGYSSMDTAALQDAGELSKYHPSAWGKPVIAYLFITGFLCSGVFGTFAGSLVDSLGRKKGVFVFCALEIAINTMEEYEDVRILFLGRVLGGISTSLLFTSFESWMVTEHRNRKFPEEWLSQTFAYGQMGNGIVAIIAGFTADISVSYMGNIGPFRTAVLVTTIVLGYVMVTWNENVGNSVPSTFSNFSAAWKTIWGDYRILLVGFTQAFFEGAMYTFVFNWVPAMYHVWGSGIKLGSIFSSFMVCITLGGFLYERATKIYDSGVITLSIFVVATVALTVPAMCPDNIYAVYGGFLLFETCVGASFACGGSARSAVMPQELQATIMNVFRIPLNILVVVGTSLDSFATTRQKLCVCVQWLLFAVILQAVYVAKNPAGVVAANPKAVRQPKASGKRTAVKRKQKTKRAKTPSSRRKRTPSKKVKELRELL